MTILLNQVSVNTVSAEFISEGGSAIINVRADDFDGAMVEIKMASEGDSLDRFVTLPDGTFTDSSSVKINYLAQGVKVLAELSGSGGSTSNVFCDILQ